MLYTAGMALTMPTLTLLALDLFPHNRGMAASLQASQHGMFTAITAAAIVPHVAHSALAVALTASGLLACGTLCVWIYLHMPKSKAV
jgi:DHA1 family bicyclomycin/chloramphenicol resistance-like MFS transporter